MVIKVVGNDPSVVKRVTCFNCSAVLEYTPNDEQKDYTSDYTGGKDYYHYIVCPCCSKQVTTRTY